MVLWVSSGNNVWVQSDKASLILFLISNLTQIYLFYKFILFFFLGLHLQHMEVSRPGVESELQLLAYATATAMQDPSSICNLHHSSWQHQILNTLIEARDWTHNLTVPSWIRFHCTTTAPQWELPKVSVLKHWIIVDLQCMLVSGVQQCIQIDICMCVYIYLSIYIYVIGYYKI